MRIMTMTILITGGAGFIGSSLCNFLIERENQIICLDNFDTFYSEEIKLSNIHPLQGSQLFTLIRGDIRDNETLNNIFTNYKIDLVIHLAAKAGVRDSIKDPSIYFDVNVNGSIQLLEAMKKYNVHNLIFASSSSVYGNKRGKLCETDNCDNPISPYAVSKKTIELLNYHYHINNDFNIINLRLFSIYGKRQRPDLVIHKFFNRLTNNLPIEVYGDGNNFRDYTYIDDVIQAFYSSILYLTSSSSPVYEILNIGNDKPVTLLVLIKLIKEIISVENIQIVNKAEVEGDVNSTHASIDKASHMLNYYPKTTLNEGIKEFHKWYQTKNF